MTATLCPWSCGGLLVVVLPLAAQGPPTPTRETTEARTERLIRELGSPRYAARERAMRELGGLKEKALAPLKKALAGCRSPEVERRIHLLLDQLAPPVAAKPLDLQARCHKMFAMQCQVYHGTKALAQAIDGNSAKKPTRANTQDALALADAQRKNINEALQAIQMLRADGTAAAFQEVFTQVFDEMRDVQKRLQNSDVGKVNQDLQQDLIDTLWEMIRALEPRRR
jgi:hypothetical protein